MKRLRSGALVLLAVAGTTASFASAAPTPAKFAVTFSATQVSTFRYDECAPNGLTMNAAVNSVEPITAMLTGTTLTFTPNTSYNAQHLQMTATMVSAACPNLQTAKTCGPTTGFIRPGLRELKLSAGTLTARYQSGFQFFPGTDPCESGIIEMGSAYPDTTTGSTRFNPADLLKRKTTDVAGTWTHDMAFTGNGHDGAEHTVVNFTVRFVRLP
jgi:hypothetical protein